MAATDGDRLIDPIKYQHVFSSLQYLSLTRPDLAYMVNQARKFVHQPTIVHWTIVNCVLHYLKGNFDNCIIIQHGSLSQLQAYSDTDRRGDRNFTGGYCVLLGIGPIS